MPKIIDYSILPEHMQEGMRLYIEKGIPPGSFLTAVLENDLVASFGQADYINQSRLLDFAVFLMQQAPQECWGDTDTVNRWLEGQGMMQYEVNDAQRT